MLEKNLDIKNDLQEILLIADSLSSHKRLQILQEIKKGNGGLSHKKLAERVGIKSSSITFHLSSLIASGLVDEETGRGMLGRKNKTPKQKITKIVIEL